MASSNTAQMRKNIRRPSVGIEVSIMPRSSGNRRKENVKKRRRQATTNEGISSRRSSIRIDKESPRRVEEIPTTNRAKKAATMHRKRTPEALSQRSTTKERRRRHKSCNIRLTKPKRLRASQQKMLQRLDRPRNATTVARSRKKKRTARDPKEASTDECEYQTNIQSAHAGG